MRPLITAIIFLLLLVLLPVHPSLGCTTFCMDTPDGPIFGSNLDLFIPGEGLVFINQRGIAKEGFQKSTAGERAKWVSRYGSVTFNLAGREFAFGGMNEAGLVVGSMELLASELPQPDERKPLTIGTWAQYVLDTCGSVREVIQVDSKVRIEDSAPPVHFLVADAEGDCAAIEYMEGKLVVHTSDTLPARAMTNMPYGRALAALKRGGPRWWWSNPGRSAERFAAAHARNRGYDVSRNGHAVKYAFETLARVVAAPHTKWNIVYNIPYREVWFRSVASPSVKHLSLHDFDLSCEAPLLMLDVNVGLEGNVASSCIPYDHGVNLDFFRTLCRRYKLDVSEEDAEKIIRHFEGFECAR